MQHSFDVEIAMQYGIKEAILLNHLYFWIEKNKANNVHYYDGAYWTYNSIKAFKELFPYMSERQINNSLNKLKEQGLIITGNYNKSTYDRTTWYAFTEIGIAIMQKCKMHFTKVGVSIMQKCKMEDTKVQNGYVENVKPIPDNKPDNKHTYKECKKFIKPSIEEIQKYCDERNNGINAEAFYDFYESKNWYVGKNKMKDWEACIRTWERRSEISKPKAQNNAIEPKWLDKEIEEEVATEEEIKQLEKRLNRK